MAITDTVVVNHMTEDPETGAIEIEFSWNGLIHPHNFTARSEIVQQFQGGIPNPEVACFMIYSWWLSRNPDASNFNLINGKTFEFDFAVQNLMKMKN